MKNWHKERQSSRAEDEGEMEDQPEDKVLQDHFDGKQWQKFCNDPEIQANGGPSFNAALELCADGVSPFKRPQHSMWLAAMSALNLPPFRRHTLDTMHLLFVIPGPKEPVSCMHL